MCKIIRRQIIIITILAFDDNSDDGNECKGDFIHWSHIRELNASFRIWKDTKLTKVPVRYIKSNPT